MNELRKAKTMISENMNNDLKTVRDALEKIEAKIRQKKGFYAISVGHDEVKKAHKAGILKGLDIVHEEVKRELDRMIETPAPQGWSAIETAPKDGTEILLALWSGHPEHKTSFCWAINGYYKDGFFYSKDPMIGKLASPTHWQPITAPTPAPTEKYIDWDGLDKIRKSATGKVLDQLNAWCYANDTRKTGNNAPTEKVDLDALKREALDYVIHPNNLQNIKEKDVDKIFVGARRMFDYLANTGRLR